MRLFSVAKNVLDMPRWAKRTLIVLTDISLCILAVWVAYFLRLSVWVPLYDDAAPAAIGSLVIALPIFGLMGLYRPVLRYIEGASVNHIVPALLVYSLVYFVVFTAWSVPNIPRTIGVIQPVLLFVFMVLVRVAARYLLTELLDRQEGMIPLKRVMIYGAGVSGRQLAAAIDSHREMKVVGFLDDDRRLKGATIRGIRIYLADQVMHVVDRLDVDEVLLAIPSATQRRRNEILANLRSLRVTVRTLPDLMEMALADEGSDRLTDLDIDDLLGRDPVLPDRSVMDAHVRGQVILVTGAGGSIGSELCRQIVASRPMQLLLVESSEFALYSIHRELEIILQARDNEAENRKTILIPLLGSVQDEDRMNAIVGAWRPSHVYHAAAYKHVPLVEHNPIQGICNNVFGTINVANCCVRHGVEHFVLVSTDKAVRPTNIMGATKRLAEMALQSIADQCTTTRLSMVRFGNVLGSSGSVVPLFRQQIMAGGPITITDMRITRFFMSIPEAAQLVIQAGAMASGGEVFVLDMGEPVRIVDLARNIVELSGLTIKDEENPFGDIELRQIGLRPGEKLYEELLIEDAPIDTGHPRIRKAIEAFLPHDQLSIKLTELRTAISKADVVHCKQILCDIIPEFQSNAGVFDYVHLQSRLLLPEKNVG
jgi:FlaA1/EpsC-like NDP-sugar epimerase